MRHSPLIIFAIGALALTGVAAWIVRSIVTIGRATRIGETNAD